jgi:hypothetical protein
MNFAGIYLSADATFIYRIAHSLFSKSQTGKSASINNSFKANNQ